MAAATLLSSAWALAGAGPLGLDTGVFARSLARGPLAAGLTAFLGGLLVCLTPCVYPMIAITVSVFGARQTTSRMQAMALSTAFVLGIAAMFTPLGVLAGTTGSLFGSALSNGWVVTGVALVFALLAASMFGAFELMLPSGVTNRLAQVGGIGYLGAFLLGLVSGIVAAPCTGPVLAGILLWIGQMQNAWLGGLAMLAFSLGLGLPFWLVGTFALRLPKSGPWMIAVKTFFGIVLATGALYFLRTAVPRLSQLARHGTGFAAMSTLLGVVGLVAALVVAAKVPEGTRRAALAKGGGVLAAIAGLFLLVSWWELPPEGIPWRPFDAARAAHAQAEQRPLLLDFTADWCGACKELAKHTFSDRAVMAEAERFEALRVDATRDDDPSVEAVQTRYHVVGLPTVLVIDGSGQERARITEFVQPASFLQSLRMAP